jgi:heme/copper-type cytochrome/quinol oxidase subunit 2
MNRHAITVAVLWAIFTIAGIVLVLNFSPFPAAASEQAHIVDDAFTLLTLLSVPVFALVVAMLLYSFVKFGQNSQPEEDGPPIHSNKRVVFTWILLSTILTIVVIIHPGITGILELRADGEEIDLVVQVEG